jgi:transposase InsO family protein
VLADAEDLGQVQRVESGGQGLGELAVDAQPFQRGGQAAQAGEVGGADRAAWGARLAATIVAYRQAERDITEAAGVGRLDRDASSTTAFGTVFQAAGARVVRSAVQAPRMNSVMERRIGSCRRELLDRTLIWNQRHLMIVLREYEDFYNTHRPHRTLNQAAPLRPLPGHVTDLDRFRIRRRDRAGRRDP